MYFIGDRLTSFLKTLPIRTKGHISVSHLKYMFYKHMKFQNRALLCLAIYDFEARIMLNFSRYGDLDPHKSGPRNVLFP